jgi:hypothetical protein
MSATETQLDLLEANLRNLSVRMPDLPYSQVLLCRLLTQIGREITAMLEHRIRPFGLAEAEFRVLSTLFSQPDGTSRKARRTCRASAMRS